MVSRASSRAVTWGDVSVTHGALAIGLFSLLSRFLGQTGWAFIVSKLMISSACAYVRLSVCGHSHPRSKESLLCPSRQVYPSSGLRAEEMVEGLWCCAPQSSYFLHVNPSNHLGPAARIGISLNNSLLPMLPYTSCLGWWCSLRQKCHFSFIYSFAQKYLFACPSQGRCHAVGWEFADGQSRLCPLHVIGRAERTRGATCGRALR